MNHLLSLRIRKLGYSLLHPCCWNALRYGVAPSLEHRVVLAELDYDLLIDVGANRGQFSLMSSFLHPDVPIHAFEPLESEAGTFRKIFAGKPHIELQNLALGEREAQMTMHVSGRADSSSLLPIGKLQRQLYPATLEVGIQSVKVVPLDSLSGGWAPVRRWLLKLDVQGFELDVLLGAKATLQRCTHVYAECSHVTLYEGQKLYPEVERFLHEHGFAPRRRLNEQWSNGQLIQADYLFTRNAAAA